MWYLPHHGVLKTKIAAKLREVFDSAATCGGTSLKKTTKYWTRFVEQPLWSSFEISTVQLHLVADIEAMFHQVKFPESDRDSSRFLWWPNRDLNRKPIAYRMTSHPFGVTSFPTCAALALNQTIESNQAGHDERKLNIAKGAFYVDDCLLSLNTPEEVSEMAKCLKEKIEDDGDNAIV